MTDAYQRMVRDLDAQRKVLATLQAEAALMGREVLMLPDGRILCCKWGWCRVLRNLRDLARYLDREGIV